MLPQAPIGVELFDQNRDKPEFAARRRELCLWMRTILPHKPNLRVLVQPGKARTPKVRYQIRPGEEPHIHTQAWLERVKGQDEVSLWTQNVEDTGGKLRKQCAPVKLIAAVGGTILTTERETQLGEGLVTQGDVYRTFGRIESTLRLISDRMGIRVAGLNAHLAELTPGTHIPELATSPDSGYLAPANERVGRMTEGRLPL